MRTTGLGRELLERGGVEDKDIESGLGNRDLLSNYYHVLRTQYSRGTAGPQHLISSRQSIIESHRRFTHRMNNFHTIATK